MEKVLLLLFVCFFSCDNNAGREIRTSDVTLTERVHVDGQSVEVLQDTERADVSDEYIMEGKNIVFFLATQEEFDSFIANKSDDSVREINDLLADAYSPIYFLTRTLKNKGIRIEESRIRFFKIKTSEGYILFDKTANNKMFGVIMSDGKKAPLIIEGEILNEEDYQNLIYEYFNIKLQED